MSTQGNEYYKLIAIIRDAIFELSTKTNGRFSPAASNEHHYIVVPKKQQSLLAETRNKEGFSVYQYCRKIWKSLYVTDPEDIDIIWSEGGYRAGRLPKDTWAIIDCKGYGNDDCPDAIVTFKVGMPTKSKTQENEMKEISNAKVVCPLKAKVTAEEAARRIAKFAIPLESGVTLTKFTEAIGYTGGDVRSLRKALAANNIATVEYGGKNYIRYSDAAKLLQVVYGPAAKKLIKKVW